MVTESSVYAHHNDDIGQEMDDVHNEVECTIQESSVSSERHSQSRVNENAKVPKRHQDLSLEPSDRQSCALSIVSGPKSELCISVAPPPPPGDFSLMVPVCSLLPGI